MPDAIGKFCQSNRHAECFDETCACKAAVYHGDHHPDAAILIEWTETRHYKAEIDPDKARELFGLGGTDASMLPLRIRTLAVYDPAILTVLDAHAAETARTSPRLERISGLSDL